MVFDIMLRYVELNNEHPFRTQGWPLISLQVAEVTRPLMSVGRICDSKMQVIFDDAKAAVETMHGTQVCVSERKLGVLYACNMRLTLRSGRHG